MKPVKMKNKINSQLLLIAAVAIIATTMLVTGLFYTQYREQIQYDLETYVHLLKCVDISKEGTAIQELHELDHVRITVIKPDGTVAYDTDKDVIEMGNHLDRPEVKAALEEGEGRAVRQSATMEKNTYYYAVKTEDGNILRVSVEANNIINILYRIIPAVAVIMVILFIVCIGFSQLLTSSLLSPIEQMASGINDNIGDMAIYEEMKPFIETIERQHEDILKSANMRQEFTANVSHELKTPLAAISGYSELIESGIASADDTGRFASEIHKSADRLLTLINDIIKLSELDSSSTELRLDAVDLYQIADTCVNMLQVSAEKHDVQLVLGGEHCTIQAEKGMIEEVIYNLCDNAIRYNVKGGSVNVSVYKDGEYIILRVKDSGIGISKEHQERIFERFYRVDKSRSKQTGGTGLGLAIVKHIVVRHNALLELNSEAGKGTEIKIKFKSI